ncbi:hypothetical protein Avbf_12985 [Armadillidium vulgare]|nr:hypothetical protein Avbf_12985 [Armadillidium vulgare]
MAWECVQIDMPELVLFGIIRCKITFLLNRTFEKSLHFQEFTDLIPVSFVLGFYVSVVMSRWWSQYNEIPWCSSLAVFVTNTIIGNVCKTDITPSEYWT